MSAPRVSVVMASYNHAEFVRHSIKSVLDQTFEDFEFLISDDGSSDETAKIVQSFSDSRISFSPNSINRGAAATTNSLIEAARGEFVAIINSDDMWLSDKLSIQLDFLDRLPSCDAMFGQAIWVDRQGDLIDEAALGFGKIFQQPNRSSGAWLRRLFMQGNCLCHPSVLIRRGVYSDLGGYDNRFRQLPDFDMWVRLVKRYNIHVSPLNFVKFRILPGENASAPIAPNIIRDRNEFYLIARRFFDGASADLLQAGFSDHLKMKELPTNEHVLIEAAFLHLMSNTPWDNVNRVIGLESLYGLLGNELARAVLWKDYGFDDRSFQKIMAEVTTFQETQEARAVEKAVGDTSTLELTAVIRRRLASYLRKK